MIHDPNCCSEDFRFASSTQISRFLLYSCFHSTIQSASSTQLSHSIATIHDLNCCSEDFRFASSTQISRFLSHSCFHSTIQSASSIPRICYPILLSLSSIREDADSPLSILYAFLLPTTCLPIITFALASNTLSSSTFFFSDSNSSFFPFYKLTLIRHTYKKFIVFLRLHTKLAIDRRLAINKNLLPYKEVCFLLS